VGYPFEKKGWKVYDLESGELFVGRDVVFYENVFPYVGNKLENIQIKMCLGVISEVR